MKIDEYTTISMGSKYYLSEIGVFQYKRAVFIKNDYATRKKSKANSSKAKTDNHDICFDLK